MLSWRGRRLSRHNGNAVIKIQIGISVRDRVAFPYDQGNRAVLVSGMFVRVAMFMLVVVQIMSIWMLNKENGPTACYY